MNRIAPVLKQYLKRKLESSPGYSLRALARDTKISPSYLSEVIKGKKKPGYDRMIRIAHVLDIDSSALEDLKLSYVPKDFEFSTLSSRRKSERSENRSLMNSKTFRILRNWYYLAILDLTTCKDFSGTTKEICVRLGLHPASVEVAVREMISHGLLMDQAGRLRKTQEHIQFSSAQSREDLRGFHIQVIRRAEAELMNARTPADVERREISSATTAVNPRRIPKAKKMLTDALKEITAYLSDGDCTEVYHISAQLFPATKKS